ncbi:type I DNA topoisomerase [Lacihabitans sp. LS3-19]|uniref:type I DNA topoisomerase n=1 Tax=Lacihabitans sp. LS3-19 TaxID=2487335 RepID=UPI0020CDA822|nr:type I DNA topoisomerase [Lacihabitans sp. LS3-19]MCP9767608.1 type I DNA topoisomerase [Lacihabitans sp. LS3-19]
MSKNLVIVESPAKAKTIEGYLGSDFIVKSSFGHIRDLPDKELGVDVDKEFEPTYQISTDKVKVVNELKKLAKDKVVWLATDDDREGEAISWHLKEALGLDDDTKRIVFREITKTAINKAIEIPRTIDIDLVNAQQARRILDRLVGFQLSPVLWKKIRAGDRKNLSAGRVQSVTVRIVVEREREIESFNSKSSFKVVAQFLVEKNKVLTAELSKNFEKEEEAEKFLKDCLPAVYAIAGLEVKPTTKSPAAPFTTSTLQQEASRKLGFSVLQTMTLAQKLYESGKITYMRTDSTSLSAEAMENAKNQIVNAYGEKFSKARVFKTKDKSAQEAHEAIRPTDFAVNEAGAERNEKRLYDLIWKRAIASQMADAIIERTIAKISISTRPEELTASGEVIKFEGFLKVYLESSDDEDEENKDMLPPLSVGQALNLIQMRGTERFTRPPARYTEASLVKKLEELGIGRPSTYAPTISTVIRREYVVKEDRPGQQREYKEFLLKDNEVKSSVGTENFGTEKSKLFPTNLGIIVNDYLVENFEDVLNYKFTAKVENEFDEVAEGKVSWQKMIGNFYNDFHAKIEEATGENGAKAAGSYELGVDPDSGKKVFAKIGRFGPYLQVGEATDEDKPAFVSIKKGTIISSITFEEALAILQGPKLPLELGLYEGNAIVVNEGRYGPYILYNGKYYNLEKTEDPLAVTKERAIEIIAAKMSGADNSLPRDMADFDGLPVIINKGRFGPYIKHGTVYYNIGKTEDPLTIDDKRVGEIIVEQKEAAAKKIIREFPENDKVKVLNGRYGPYIQVGKRNVKIPKGTVPEELTLEDCLKLAEG